jgi:hypothetical protein
MVCFAQARQGTFHMADSPGSEIPPEGWPGWPEGKKFAVVLTHDVEGPSGLDKTRDLMQLEKELGFRSSFNFIPEGVYQVPSALRQEITSNGFEVGVHDLHHDGKLYRSQSEFERNAVRINSYLKAWGAAGFRSGFMLNRLDWMHHLDVLYDASTFDTDPFEPQPFGVRTIFPFWVPAPGGAPKARTELQVGVGCGLSGPRVRGGGGFIELPYTPTGLYAVPFAFGAAPGHLVPEAGLGSAPRWHGSPGHASGLHGFNGGVDEWESVSLQTTARVY